MSWLFINFRKQDEPGFAALLQRELSRCFGAGAVFYASSTIRPGDDFEAGLLSGVRNATALVAVIGPRWLTARHESGGRAVDRGSDWVRREIAEAFACGTRVVPVLVNDAVRLTDAALPEDIDRLTRCQNLRLRHENLEFDLARITVELGALLPPRSAATRSPAECEHQHPPVTLSCSFRNMARRVSYAPRPRRKVFPNAGPT